MNEMEIIFHTMLFNKICRLMQLEKWRRGDRGVGRVVEGAHPFWP